jgi:hypothetical protein
VKPTKLDRIRALRTRQQLGLASAESLSGATLRDSDEPAPPDHARCTVTELRKRTESILAESKPLPCAEANGDEVLTRRQVANLFHVSEHHVSKLIRHGLPHCRPQGLLRFFRSEVIAWMKSHREDA